MKSSLLVQWTEGNLVKVLFVHVQIITNYFNEHNYSKLETSAGKLKLQSVLNIPINYPQIIHTIMKFTLIHIIFSLTLSING